MKIDRKEVISYKEVYVANDGTEFVDKDECLKYEKTCSTILKMNAYRCKMDTDINGEYLMNEAMYGMGWDDHIIVFNIKTSDNLDDVNKYLNAGGDGYTLILDKKYIGQKVAIGNYDDYSFYILGTMDDILDRVRKAFEPCFKEKEDAVQG